MATVTSKLPLDLLPPQYGEMIPKEGFPPVLSGLWQVLCAWILGAAGNGSAGLAWTMYILYVLFIFVYIYFILRSRATAGL